MSNQSIRIRREDIQPGDVIVVTAAGDPYITVAREVPPFAVGTVVQNVEAPIAVFFRSTRGWVNRFGSETETDDAFFRDNAIEYPVVFTPKEA